MSIFGDESAVSSIIKPPRTPAAFTKFKSVSEAEVRKIINASPNKQCNLDPCPTALVKCCIDILITPITAIINKSLQEGSFPFHFKKAIVTPLIKKPTLPKNDLKNYWPVSNLNFISKLIEKVVAFQIKEHLNKAGLENGFQSAYKANHSTETTLLGIQNDILVGMDQEKVTALTLLDLSAAFDTIDHKMLLDRLSEWFGVGGVVLNWFTDYLCGRNQCIKVQGHLSEHRDLNYGVPQGSVLGPLLFSMYTHPLSHLINRFDVKHKLYADDTQIYLSFSKKNQCASIDCLKQCLAEVQNWMYQNRLKLNPDKTEFLLIGNDRQRAKYSNVFPLELMGNEVVSSSSARNLGFMFDEDFSMDSHIKNLCKNCYYHIRDFRRIRAHMDVSVATSLANALVSSRLDYCNSLFCSF